MKLGNKDEYLIWALIYIHDSLYKIVDLIFNYLKAK